MSLSTEAQSLLLAATDHNLLLLRSLLKSHTPNVQDPSTLRTPLHLAIASFETNPLPVPSNQESNHTNGSNGASIERKEDELSLPPLTKATKTLELLLQNGAIWNSLDINNETPGCIAYRLGLKELYEVMVDAGVRAELLFGRLDGYMALDDEDDDEDDQEEIDEDAVIDISTEQNKDTQEGIEEEEAPELVSTEQTALEKATEEAIPVTSDVYLSSTLSIDDDKILDEDKNGVMMSWESHIMSLTVQHLLTPAIPTGPKILNIGYGMGIIDSYFQSSSPTPSSHHIIEAHPQILQKLSTSPLSKNPNVTIHSGKWQEILPKLVNDGDVTFDAIYFDTFAEDYSQLKLFFTEYVIALLNPEGKFGFFNGLGADRQIAYDVYKKVVDIDLLEAGLETEWIEVEVDSKKMEGDGEWKGVRRKYWDLEKYWLPVSRFIG
ncbi:Arginine N-methyltransferase 2 [Orbilia oligospora]|uniref:Arginine N-methyltransferase 2 n=1 Tax=Orbilia oligospora TaxID=2813651 RepID=A0A6G1MR02_ORBOL|nr:Arginine N-methyltransferase 2 [Orbilia oligospora]KAF3197081.1 Arginine N-methyltransferase 2 [Orbilia oligospora]KAF3215939.1 Arginine N-methyltransferase 2 [Orbilia oligospora]KAF3231345.1 Arginine N-methyltransferase 2 [Orbilia oligospora]KAF3265448.1 Arginine N-methyltransferase 2 [Orbilia oligospora]